MRLFALLGLLALPFCAPPPVRPPFDPSVDCRLSPITTPTTGAVAWSYPTVCNTDDIPGRGGFLDF